MANDYTNEIMNRFRPEDPKATCRNITFQVTDDCCLKCTYCYQIHKGHKMMSQETAKAGVDLLFQLYNDNEENNVINKHVYGIILDFIGGEPFMNVPIMSFIIDYFIQKCIEQNHIWLTNFRVAISTNGILYFTPEVQAFLKKYKKLISMNITIDGPKNIHDTCRIDPDGKGSYDKVIKAWEDWFQKTGEGIETKVTIAPENLLMLEDTFDFFISKGCTTIHANPIFEHKWTVEEAQDYYIILKHIADKLLANPNIHSSLFDIYKFQPLDDNDTQNYCGGTSAMLAFDPDGLAYPCLRYMASSLGTDREPIIIGNVYGIYNTPKYQAIHDDMQKVTRQSQSTEECIHCPIAAGCAWCSAWNYQETGSYNKRSTNICWMHRAQSLANVYYWNNYCLNTKQEKNFPLYLPREIAIKIIPESVYNDLCFLTIKPLKLII